MEQHVLLIFIDYKGLQRKGVAIYIAAWVNLRQKRWFHWTKNVFLNTAEFQARKTLLIDIIFAMKKISVDLFRAAPYILMLELQKDVLFHYLVVYCARVKVKVFYSNSKIIIMVLHL